jgi:hypothetical protein
MTLSLLAQSLRLRYGLRWTGKTPDGLYRFLFKTVVACAVIVMVVTHNDLKERAAIMEQVLTVYEPIVTTFHQCETGATGYYYADGRTYECGKKL